MIITENTIKEVHDFWNNRITYIQEQKEKGVKTIVFAEKLKKYHPKYYFDDLSPYPDIWWNLDYARYYGVDSVVVIERK